MWIFVQRTGRLYDPAGTEVGVGYSGHGSGINNPAAQAQVGVGPCPVGYYTIGLPHRPVDHLGPVALPLVPKSGTAMHGRSGFFVHGDNQLMNKSASNGCLIFARNIRQIVNDSSDKLLCVVSEEADKKGIKLNGPTKLSGAAAVPSLSTGNGSAVAARVAAAAARQPEMV